MDGAKCPLVCCTDIYVFDWEKVSKILLLPWNDQFIHTLDIACRFLRVK